MLNTVRHPVRITLASLAVAAVTAGGAVAVPAQASPIRAERGSSCATYWGSLPEANTRWSATAVHDIRTGQHPCFDRLVVDLAGKSAAYRVSYVSVVVQDGSGTPIALRGGAKLRIDIEANSYDADGRPTYPLKNFREVTSVAGYDTFRQVAWGGSFEGRTTLALGVRARLPFQTHLIPGPANTTRLVIDVAHHW
ncbi:hypothetical protein F1D05_00460 [Kribbella qitaiheensis]|uniref:AMIN-like domain-containing protein n=1 Tax=Kribbella qitaiheensis TaxID=1544730 RepID=A0A7G6WRN1_9ACTN|nr:hypothetical protein [Kribbella qitaiheensis]QNE16646.1 hypothetical protein F1D05_00460 [Kribbella qitaiheensis]